MRAEQLEELPGLRGCGDLAAIHDEMAVFGIDRGVGGNLGELGDDAGFQGARDAGGVAAGCIVAEE